MRTCHRSCVLLAQAGHDAIHTLDLPTRNLTRNGEINRVSLDEERIVITKGTDFYYSHVLQGRPWKLVLLRTGNISLAELKTLFARHLPAIEQALQSCTLVEVDRQTVAGRVEPAVARWPPHRAGRARFRHPVPPAEVLLRVV